MTGLRILLVEDDAVIVMAMQETLETMGHLVCGSASTEADAVAKASHLNPDLIIADARLRVGSGIAAMRKILSVRSIAHVYVSGDSLSDGGLGPGAIIMSKPFSDEDLRRAVELATSSSSPALREGNLQGENNEPA